MITEHTSISISGKSNIMKELIVMLDTCKTAFKI